MGITDRVRRRLGALLDVSAPASERLKTQADSVSRDEEAYLDVCRLAPIDASVFGSFRRHPGYTRVLEHTSEAQGREYLRLLSPGGSAQRHVLEAAKSDGIGQPVTIRIDAGVEISPSTLRYLKVADDIERLFGSLDGASVVEIGVGYGGQCRLLDMLFRIKSYTLVDLRPVLNLTEEFLSHFPLRTSISFVTMNELAARPYDFALSNYAFSELSRQVQETYYEKALRQTVRGYITYNNIGPAAFNPMTSDELCRLLGAKTFPEEPLTHPSNLILAWGTGR